MTERTNLTVLAFESGDGAASRRVHEATSPEWEEDGHNCGTRHVRESERVEAGIGGACLTLIASATLGDVAERRFCLTALGLAGGLATALQKMSFERWYRRRYQRERAREAWELENFPKGEREEMTGLFAFKGMSAADAETVVTTMSQYKEFFVNLMMTEELQLREPLERLAQRALAVGASFSFAALLPLSFSDLSRRRISGVDDTTVLHGTALALLAVLGARRATMCVLHVKTHVLETLLLGLACLVAPKIVAAFFFF